MQVPVYNTQGKEVEKTDIPEAVFGVTMNPIVVKQVIIAMAANTRQPYAHAKDRSEQRGGGKKPWKQKGTGRARHGSRRSPIWVGGGVTFGPTKERNWKQKLNKKVRRKALYMMLSDKVQTDHLIVVEDMKLEAIKTKALNEILTALPSANRPALILTAERDDKLLKSAQNLQKVTVEQAQNINAALLAKYEYVIASKSALDKIIATFSK